MLQCPANAERLGFGEQTSDRRQAGSPASAGGRPLSAPGRWQAPCRPMLEPRFRAVSNCSRNQSLEPGLMRPPRRAGRQDRFRVAGQGGLASPAHGKGGRAGRARGPTGRESRAGRPCGRFAADQALGPEGEHPGERLRAGRGLHSRSPGRQAQCGASGGPDGKRAVRGDQLAGPRAIRPGGRGSTSSGARGRARRGTGDGEIAAGRPGPRPAPRASLPAWRSRQAIAPGWLQALPGEASGAIASREAPGPRTEQQREVRVQDARRTLFPVESTRVPWALA